MQLLGGSDITVNGSKVKMNETYIYKGMMISNVPNLIYSFGYTNASWTLKVDLTANYLCRLIKYMEKQNHTKFIPIPKNVSQKGAFLNLKSGYILRAHSILPKQGARVPWKNHNNYLLDMVAIRFGRLKNSAIRFI